MPDHRDDEPQCKRVPLLPLRDIVIFPHMVVPLFVGREKSLGALGEATARGESRDIFLSAQRWPDISEPAASDIFPVGTLASLIQVLRLPDGTVKVLVEGRRRATIRSFVDSEGFFAVEVEEIAEPDERSAEVTAAVRALLAAFESYVKLSKGLAPELLDSVHSIESPGELADTIAGQLQLKLVTKQALLEMTRPLDRLLRLSELLRSEIEVLQTERKLRGRPRRQVEKRRDEPLPGDGGSQPPRDPGERDDLKNELGELEEKAASVKLSAEAAARVKKEMKKLRLMAPMSAEAAVVRGYIDWVLALPWGVRTEDRLDVAAAEQVLDRDHFGLRKVKERILEYLAVQALVKKQKGPILCLVGPPGVGKTSLARSIATATGRNFVRLALGGVRDEAEIRGHRRTYIGALPGKIIQSLKKAGSTNPVFLLDEVDKMSADFRGDPAAALLEVLDPEQNNTFCDHYLDLDYDLSDVMFITTANYMQGIPGAPAGPHGDRAHPGLHRVREAGHRRSVPRPQAEARARLRRAGHRLAGRNPARPHPGLHEGGRRAQPRAGNRLGLPQDRPRVPGRPERDGLEGHAQAPDQVPGAGPLSAWGSSRRPTRSA